MNVLKSAAKALGVGFLAYLIGTVAQLFHVESCADKTTCPTSPTTEHIALVSALVFALAFCAFLVRAYRRQRMWRV